MRNNIISQASIVKFLVFVVYLAYLSIGFFPSAPIESDGNGIANGAAMMAVHGFGVNDFSYRYEVQTGSYVLIVWLHNLTGLSTISAFSLLSAISSLGFIVASAALINRITNVSFAISGIMLLLFQEATTGGYYANTSVIAGAFLMAALYYATITNKRYLTIISAILLGISIWVRFDSILIAPVLGLLLYRSSWKVTLREFTLVIVIAAIISTLAIYFSGSSYSAIIETAKGHIEEQYSGTLDLGIPLIGNVNFKSHLSIFSFLSLFMLIIGIAELALTRNWYILGTVLLGIIPFYSIYWGKLTTPKYLYYLLPFFSILTVSALAALRQASQQMKRFYIAAFSILFVAQYIVGIRANFNSKPYIEVPFPTLANLITINNPSRAIKNTSLVIGAGTYINTDDGDRLSSGILFAPITWNNEKSRLVSDMEDLSRYIREIPEQSIYILVDTFNAEKLTVNFLLNEGYNCIFQKDSQKVNCVKGTRVINLVIMPEIAERRIDLIDDHINVLGVPKLIFIVPTPWEKYLLEQYLSSNKSWVAKKIGDFSYELQIQP